MSIPFSNTHYRIPQGFGNLLEGLTREILREQPENIPAFAAAYFENLLEKREKTNFDPAEWGAKVDDRFYNNHAFKEQESPENCESEKEKSPPSVKEDETPVTAFWQGSEMTKGNSQRITYHQTEWLSAMCKGLTHLPCTAVYKITSWGSLGGSAV
uniref:Sperm surface protein Sp17 n=1 Tax=Canis lupus familiaris TaxID=9615 RepID=A0A8C0LWV5_CANLF